MRKIMLGFVLLLSTALPGQFNTTFYMDITYHTEDVPEIDFLVSSEVGSDFRKMFRSDFSYTLDTVEKKIRYEFFWREACYRWIVPQEGKYSHELWNIYGDLRGGGVIDTNMRRRIWTHCTKPEREGPPPGEFTMEVYPNPTYGPLYTTIRTPWQIKDKNGRLLADGVLDPDLTNFPAGMYYLYWGDPNSRRNRNERTFRIIKQTSSPE